MLRSSTPVRVCVCMYVCMYVEKKKYVCRADMCVCVFFVFVSSSHVLPVHFQQGLGMSHIWGHRLGSAPPPHLDRCYMPCIFVAR